MCTAVLVGRSWKELEAGEAEKKMRTDWLEFTRGRTFHDLPYHVADSCRLLAQFGW
jgi:hypothetical protein